MAQRGGTDDEGWNSTEETAVCTWLCGQHPSEEMSLHFRFKNLMCKELMGEAENNVFLGSSLLIELCFLRPAVFGTSHTYSFFLRA